MDPNLRPQVSRPPSASVPQQGGPPPLSNMTQYHMQPPYPMAQPTLPPLQHHQNPSPIPHSYMQQPYRHDMPRYPTSSADVYAASSAPMTTHAPVGSLPPSSFLGHHPQQYQPHPMLPPTTGTQAYPQPIAPAPPRDRRQDYPPVPPVPFSNAENKGPGWAGAEGMPATAPPRTQVVGSQGRRGILPSVPGRPAAIANGVNGTAKSTTIPAKDADGKFPCPHCNKTYLHAKHLKRHLLRHTGDRPYMCVLCKDTFSRSDILKRHFQKCSLRRGNPTGVSHLSHPHAHLKRAQAAGVVPKPVQGDLNVALPPIDAKNPPAVPDHDKRPVGPNANNGHAGDIDWSTVLQPGNQENYMNNVFPSSMAPVNDAMRTQIDADRKFYPTATSGQQESGGLNGLYLASTSLGGDGTLGSPPIWNFDSLQGDALQTKIDRIINFGYSAGLQEPFKQPDNDGFLEECLTTDNVKHFIELYANYQGHWAVLHVPTFDFLQAYEGLILTLCCVGAVYSDRIKAAQVRKLISFTRDAISRNSRIRKLLQDEDEGQEQGREGLATTDIEELQACHMLHHLAVYHGDPVLREQARSDTILAARLIRRLGLLTPAGPEDATCYSPLHDGPLHGLIDASIWDWRAWVEQERRLRMVYLWYLSDAALVAYWNCKPQFNPQDIKLPLPCDDAAWEAKNAQQCANALGLNGRDIQATVNRTGSRRVKQIEMHHAVSALQSPAIEFISRSTNAHSKFILIHALHVQLWLVQRQLSLESVNTPGSEPDNIAPSETFNTLSESEWEAANNEFSTKQLTSIPYASLSSLPSDALDTNTMLKYTIQALTKWKRMWDDDMAVQYPDAGPYRPFGFWRDGVHFYWLAHSLLLANRIHDWKVSPDVRFMHVMMILKKARASAQSDASERGESLGAVGNMDEGYALEGLTLDMRRLFRPLNQQFENEPSPPDPQVSTLESTPASS